VGRHDGLSLRDNCLVASGRDHGISEKDLSFGKEELLMASQGRHLNASTELGQKVVKVVIKLVDAFRFLFLLRRADIPHYFREYVYFQKHPDVVRKPGGWFYQGHFYPDYLHVGGASHAIFREALKYCQGEGLDIGAGFWPLPGSVPVDLARGPGLGKVVSDFGDKTLDYIFSSHCLEHIDNWEDHLLEWSRKLKPGGVLFLYLPHPDCAIWHPGSPFVGDGHKWIPRPETIKEAMIKVQFEINKCDDGPDAMQSFFVCGRKRDDS
jgi:hypothetical protein